ncbi:MAG: membrane protein insertion efficiency factor YidD [Acholeplasmatales bacterium]|nr:membrane protein insertion efficiency factor YidD [Acholeplasmatales bacterium]
MIFRRAAVKLIIKYQESTKDSNKHWCRFTPSCSEYAKLSFERFNFFEASFYSLVRIISCNPLSKKRFYPVKSKKLNVNKGFKIYYNLNKIKLNDLENLGYNETTMSLKHYFVLKEKNTFQGILIIHFDNNIPIIDLNHNFDEICLKKVNSYLKKLIIL